METAYIVCGITAVSAILAPVATALINQIGSFHLTKSKLLFSSKFDAYKDFIACAATFPNNSSDNEILELNKYALSAMLLSGEKTHEALAAYSALLISHASDISNNNDMTEIAANAKKKAILGMLANAQKEAIEAMRKELVFGKWYRV